MRFVFVIIIMMFSGLILGILLAIIYGPSMIEDLKQYLSDSWAGNFFDLAFAEEVQLSTHYTISIHDSVAISDMIPCEKNQVLCDYEKYMSTEHKVNMADALETRNSFAGKIGE